MKGSGCMRARARARSESLRAGNAEVATRANCRPTQNHSDRDSAMTLRVWGSPRKPVFLDLRG
jgi:hypothetical protein